MVDATGYNVFLIVVTVVAALMIAAVTVYLLAAFSHPEDRMQAWFPKIVVCCSIFVAIITVLMFPLDVANRQACSDRILFSDCDLTLPMKEMWYGVYIANIVLVYLVTPFTLFYYEADSELCVPASARRFCDLACTGPFCTPTACWRMAQVSQAGASGARETLDVVS